MRWAAAAFVAWANWMDWILTKTALSTGDAYEVNPIVALTSIDWPPFVIYKLAIVPLIAIGFAIWRPFNVGLYISAGLMALLLTFNISTLLTLVSSL